MTANRQLIILALSIFLGVAFPSLAAFARPLLLPAIFLLFTLAILQVRISEVRSALFQQTTSWIILVWQLLLLPLIVSVLLYPWHSSYWYVFAVVTMCTSSITASTALTKIFGLNDALALVVCLLGTVVMPVPLYLFLNFFTDAGVDIKVDVYVSRIAIFIVLPFLLVGFFRRVVPPAIERAVADKTPVLALTLLMFFGLSVMDGVQALLFNEPMILLSLVCLAFGISVFVQVLTFAALRFVGGRDAKTATLLCAYRNMGLVVAIAGGSLGEYFLIFVGVWQLPMYILPLVLRKIYQYQSATLQ